ncbi:unknown similar to AMEVITR09 [Choristoneura rosaceana entomopoxvirus 'L']|uniref:C2H2-type domain-containing protein n=1 Tax=Choristoneura rosaceana entomopoxvirus 'L' TaxID=1293539 RepID=A0ABM9QK73_9POXV|nr:unknown similar to AMEVITR09 [Choristoneura rosaceana entomopoxvirus 'L']CCU55941.1 unknown similar to AMEVITR09 [Choristoneura rosaceana entomopoxvirus 'L']
MDIEYICVNSLRCKQCNFISYSLKGLKIHYKKFHKITYNYNLQKYWRPWI